VVGASGDLRDRDRLFSGQQRRRQRRPAGPASPDLLSSIDYLQWLGVDAVWLTPIYPSPFRDFGYDIADYCAIDRAFGTLEDFDRLVARLHEAGIRLIMDLVPNHTSSEHAWFRESASRRTGRRNTT
jgi:alpha-glucosidase